MRVVLFVFAFILFGSNVAFAQVERVCESLINDRAKNGLFAVHTDESVTRLSSCKNRACKPNASRNSNLLDYQETDYLLYVYSRQSRFHSSGPGTDVVVAKTRTTDNKNGVEKVFVTRKNIPKECAENANLMSFNKGQELVDLNAYIRHHSTEGYEYSPKLHYKFHFKVKFGDRNEACVWTDKINSDDMTVANLFSLKNIAELIPGAGRTEIALRDATSGFVTQATASNNKNDNNNSYGSLGSELILVRETTKNTKGCFAIERPLPGYSLGGNIFTFLPRLFDPTGAARRDAAKWQPDQSILLLERWSKSTGGQTSRGAKLEYVINWQ